MLFRYVRDPGKPSPVKFVHLESGTGQQLKARASSYTAELSCGFRGLVPSGIDGFSDKRKLIAWDRPNDQLAPIAGSS